MSGCLMGMIALKTGRGKQWDLHVKVFPSPHDSFEYIQNVALEMTVNFKKHDPGMTMDVYPIVKHF